MATHFIQTPFTITKGVHENLTLQLGNLQLPQLSAAKIIRYGIYLNEDENDPTPSDPFLVKFFYEADGTTSLSQLSNTTLTTVELTDNTTQNVTQYTVSESFLSNTLKFYDECFIRRSSGYEVIVPAGREISANNGLYFITGFTITSGSILATGNVDGIFKIYFESN